MPIHHSPLTIHHSPLTPHHSPLTNSALLATLALLFAAGAAHAHRLITEYRFLPGKRIQVESWYDLKGGVPAGAAVRVYRPNDILLTEGKLDDKGIFVFSYTEAETFRVVVTTIDGHRKTVRIQVPGPGGTDPASNQAAADSADHDPDQSVPPADRSPRVTFTDVFVGIGFLLALAAFVLSCRNARELRELKRSRDKKNE